MEQRNKKRTSSGDHFQGTEGSAKRSRDDAFFGKLNLLIPTDSFGLLIGKKGAILNQIMSDSGCKYFSQPYNTLPHGGTERGLELIGSWEQIEAAERIILDKLLNKTDIDKSDWIPEGHTMEKYYIPSTKIGLLIGKGGSTITNINEESGSKVKLSNDQETPPGAKDRLLYIIGPPESNARAIEMIAELVGGSRTSQSQNDQGEGEDFLIPVGAIGYLIGHRGATIKALGEDAGAKLDVPTDAKLPMAQRQCPVRITGGALAIAKAKALLGDKVQEWRDEHPELAQGTDEGSPLDSTVTTIKIAVPEKLVPCIIGKKGSIIQEINAAVPNAMCKVLPNARSPHTLRALKPMVFAGPVGGLLEVQRRVLEAAGRAPVGVLAEVREEERRARRGESSNQNDGSNNNQNGASMVMMMPSMPQQQTMLVNGQSMVQQTMMVNGQPTVVLVPAQQSQPQVVMVDPSTGQVVQQQGSAMMMQQPQQQMVMQQQPMMMQQQQQPMMMQQQQPMMMQQQPSMMQQQQQQPMMMMAGNQQPMMMMQQPQQGVSYF